MVPRLPFQVFWAVVASFLLPKNTGMMLLCILYNDTALLNVDSQLRSKTRASDCDFALKEKTDTFAASSCPPLNIDSENSRLQTSSGERCGGHAFRSLEVTL